MRHGRLATALFVPLAAACGGSAGGPTTAAVDRCWPLMSSPEPRGTLPAGTTTVMLRMKTDRPATCRYSTVEGLRYVELESAFENTGGLEHTTPLSGLLPGGHRLFAKCEVWVDAHADCSTPHDLVFIFDIAE